MKGQNLGNALDLICVLRHIIMNYHSTISHLPHAHFETSSPTRKRTENTKKVKSSTPKAPQACQQIAMTEKEAIPPLLAGLTSVLPPQMNDPEGLALLCKYASGVPLKCESATNAETPMRVFFCQLPAVLGSSCG